MDKFFSKSATDVLNRFNVTKEGLSTEQVNKSREENGFNELTEKKKKWLEKNTPFIPQKNWLIITKEIGEYNKENRDIIKAKKIEEKGDQYNHLILLDDDHKVLREAQKELGKNADIYHVSAALI